jgi:hypothetical protein
MRRSLRCLVGAWLAVALGACSSDAPLGAGQTCTASGECAAGLLCDFTQTPHVCAGSQSLPEDMATRGRTGDAGPKDMGAPVGDGGAADLSATGGQPDLSTTD